MIQYCNLKSDSTLKFQNTSELPYNLLQYKMSSHKAVRDLSSKISLALQKAIITTQLCYIVALRQHYIVISRFIQSRKKLRRGTSLFKGAQSKQNQNRFDCRSRSKGQAWIVFRNGDKRGKGKTRKQKKCVK